MDDVSQPPLLPAKRALPVWAKIIITIVVAGLVGLVILGLVLGFYVYRILSDSTKPEYVSAALAHIAKFKEPLPAGCRFVRGVGIEPAGMYTAIAERKPAQEEIYFVSLPLPKGQPDAEDNVKDMIERGLLGIKCEAVHNKVGEQVAGENMAITRATLSDGITKWEGMLGIIFPGNSGKVIVIYTKQPPGTSFYQKETDDLLKAIEKFCS